MQLIITLPSDGAPIELRRLALFEIYGVRPEIVGPYTYDVVQVDGYVHKETFNLADVKRAPDRPVLEEGEELVPYTNRWWQFMDWQRFKAAIAHEIKRLESIEEFMRWYLTYILDNCLTNQEDRQRIQTIEDWDAVLSVVAVPRVTQEALADCFRDLFKAKYANNEIFDALEQLAEAESRSSYDVILTWEINCINESGLTFDVWMELPYAERVQRVAAANLPKLTEALALSEKTRRK